MSIPLSEIAKLTNNPEWQQNIKIMNQILINLHSGLTSFFNKPEVQQTFIAIQNAAIKFDKYLNDPIVRKNLEQFSKSIIAISNSSSFQHEYIKRRAEAPSQEEEVVTFGNMISDELVIPEQLTDLQTNDDRYKAVKIVLMVFSLIFNLYIKNLDEFNDFNEAYSFYINNIEAKAVTISRINLREAPSFQSKSLIVIPRNSILKVYKESESGWVKINYNHNNLDIEGYVSEAYIKKVQNKYDFNTLSSFDLD
ncbi:SH3 domain-containing protein [Acinetobacter johnsonii]|uniref:SH3 domain-containing protein n=1 Tax=Acinetobacter johnsonii TaxID=40214 RepID=UPI00073874CF|nr:SH3 domain-containing protein [Acinetobacter johnsonii]